MKFLITGANGFIGSHLAIKLVKEGYDEHLSGLVTSITIT
jgi:nucleoside-diphosphate-sugar epimerase